MSAGMAEATAQMCGSKTEARRNAKAELEAICREHGYKPGKIVFHDWKQQVGVFEYHYCKAVAEVTR